MKHTLYLMFCCCCFFVQLPLGIAQLHVQGLLHVQDDALVYVEPDVVIATQDGLVENNGTVVVEGNLTKEAAASYLATSTTGSREVILQGDSPVQRITGDFTGAQSFYELSLDKEAGMVELNSDIEVSQSFNLIQGKLRTDVNSGMQASDYQYELYISNPASNALTGNITESGSNNFIEGRLRRSVAGLSTYSFPVGITENNPFFVSFNEAAPLSDISASFEQGANTPIGMNFSCPNTAATTVDCVIGKWNVQSTFADYDYDIHFNPSMPLLQNCPDATAFFTSKNGSFDCNLDSNISDGITSTQTGGFGIFDLPSGNDAAVDNQMIEYTAFLMGSQENCPKISTGHGMIKATLTGSTLTMSGAFSDLTGDFDASIGGGAHVHHAVVGRNGGVALPLTTIVDADLKGGEYIASENTFELTEQQVLAFQNREFYVNIHTTTFPSGELRGQFLPPADAYFQANLLGVNEVPANNSTATGNVIFELTDNQLIVSGSFDDFDSEVATDLAGGAHIHTGFAGQNGGVLFPLNTTLDDDSQGGIFEAANNTFMLTEEQLDAINEQGLYVNVHSQENRPGEVRGQIVPLRFTYFAADLSGSQEVPPVMTSSDGRVIVTYHPNRTITVSGSFNNLESDLNTALAGGAHLHLAPRGENGGVIFPLTIQSSDTRNGVFLPQENTFTLSAEQVIALFEEGIYVNIHSIVNVPGEIRGQLVGLSIPECGNPVPEMPTADCATPSDPIVTRLSRTRLVIEWPPVSEATGYILQARLRGRTDWAITAMLNNPLARVWTIPDSDFEYRIRTICRDGSESAFSPVFEFSTRGNLKAFNVASKTTFKADIDFSQSSVSPERWQISPNPVTDRLQLIYEVLTDKAQVSIIGVNGKKLIENTLSIDNSIHSIDVNNLMPGFYILMVNDGGRNVISEKIIKESRY